MKIDSIGIENVKTRIGHDCCEIINHCDIYILSNNEKIHVGSAKDCDFGGGLNIKILEPLSWKKLDKWCKENLAKWGTTSVPCEKEKKYEVKEEDKIYDMYLELHIYNLWDKKQKEV